ncbi:hypothetical protein L7F22_056385 [Adiantum nelumboides]|nr:hypothetical protein [Adiantum nelumboides]
MGRAPCCEKVGLKRGPWTPEEDEKLVSFINEHGHGSWRALPKKAGLLRCGKSCRLRWTNYLRPDIKRGEFSASEENAILQLHALLGNRWSAIASHLPKRTDNEIKNYWNTHLRKKLVKMGLDPLTHKPVADSVLMSNSSGAAIMAEKGGKSGTHVDKSNIGSSNSNSNKSSVVSSSPNGGKLAGSNSGKEASACQLLLRGASPLTKGSSATMHLTQWESVRLEAEARLTQEAKMRARGVWRRTENCATSAVGGPNFIKGSNCLPSDAAVQESQVGSASAMELMHALQNWEKSLQGQAGVLWPDSWKVASGASSTAHQHNTCVTAAAGQSESSSSSSPPPYHHATPAASSTSALDSSRASGRITATSMPPASDPPGKLSWSNALMPPTKYPSHHDLCTLEGSASRRAGGSFSSLMLDAVLGRNSSAQAPLVLPPQVNEARASSEQELENSDAKVKNEDPYMVTADDKSPHVDEGSIVSEVTGDDVQDTEVEDGNEDEIRSLSVDGTSDLFKDLPRLKRDATTTPVSYTALLSEEISDYWSNIVLKEQVSSPTMHITF